jgi:hypothetical protein
MCAISSLQIDSSVAVASYASGDGGGVATSSDSSGGGVVSDVLETPVVATERGVVSDALEALETPVVATERGVVSDALEAPVVVG